MVDLKKEKVITIGRNLESLMVINELSVSRKHCVIIVEPSKKELMVVDLNAKFGTVVEVQRA